MSRWLLTYLLLLSSFMSMAQGIVIHGTVRFKEDDEPAAGVNVMLFGQDRKSMLGFGQTDGNGRFRLEYSGTADSLVLRCTGMDIKMQERRIPASDQRLDIIVTTSPLVIREAKVKADPMSAKGDTVVYYVGQFRDETDRAIGDVLKKMPGITVEESGRIAYNGKPINRFYIEGMDMMGKSYGVATNNVRAEDIASVEVYERHQPVKALEDIERTDQAALNLRLKDDAKGVWNAMAQLGAGYKPAMWNAEGLGMRFSKAFQTLLTYKGNNEGEDVASKEVLPFEQTDDLAEMLGIRTLSEPSIDRAKYLFNNLHAASVNAMFKLRKNLDIVAKATYLKDRQTADGVTSTKYFFKDGSPVEVNENLSSVHSTNRADLEFKIRNNSSKHYLNESVEFNGVWNEGLGTSGGVSQLHHSDKIVLKNNFTDLVRLGSKVFSVLSDVEYARLPESLSVSPFLFSDDAADAVQSVTSERLKVMNELRFSVNKGNWQFRVTGNADFHMENLESELRTQTFNIPIDSLSNDLAFRRFDIMVNPAVEYNAGEPLKLTLAFPLDYRLSKINGLHKRRLLAAPRLTVSGDASNRLRYYVSVFYNDKEGEINDCYSGYIMTDYRMLTRKAGVLPNTSSLAVSGRLEYRNPLSGLVASGSLRWSRSRRNLIFSSFIDGFRFSESALELDNRSDNLFASVNFSKRFQSLSTTISSNLNWSLSDSPIIRQGCLMSIHRSALQGKLETLTKLTSFLNMEYSCSFSDFSSGLSGVTSLSDIFLLRQSLVANLSFLKSWTLCGGFEHYHNHIIRGKDRDIFFSDLSLSYKKRRFEYSVSARNLLNRGTFSSTRSDDLIEYSSIRTLRPASVMLKLRFNIH